MRIHMYTRPGDITSWQKGQTNIIQGFVKENRPKEAVVHCDFPAEEVEIENSYFIARPAKVTKRFRLICLVCSKEWVADAGEEWVCPECGDREPEIES